MLFDLSVLQLEHLLLFGGSFVLVFGLFALLLHLSPWSLRTPGANTKVYFGGVVLIGTISLLSYFVLDDVRLRIGILAVAFLTLLIGIIDEQVSLSAGNQFTWQVVIASIAVLWGWTIHVISNPWATDAIALEWYRIGAIALPGGLIAVVWLVFLINALNWFDGIDGLAGGVGASTLATLALISLLPSTQDSQTLSLAMIGAGSCLGFLVWNFAPAKVYLGTSGSWFLGLFIGMVAIVGGGKLVTTLLALSLPVIDVLAVVIARLWARQSPWQGDQTRHLHYRLQAAGLSARVIAILGISSSAILGIAAILLQTHQKIMALVLVAIMLLILLSSLVYKQRLSN